MLQNGGEFSFVYDERMDTVLNVRTSSILAGIKEARIKKVNYFPSRLISILPIKVSNFSDRNNEDFHHEGKIS